MFRVVLLTEKGQVTCKTRMPIEEIRTMVYDGDSKWIRLACLDDHDDDVEVRVLRERTFGAIIMTWRKAETKPALVQPMIQ